MEILQVENLTFAYPQAQKKAIENISFSVEGGDFVLLCGDTGSGKTTLMRLLKKEIAPFGEKSGRIFFNGKELETSSVGDVGFVMQNPENQIVCDKVWHELAFGLENLGYSTDIIRRKVAETAGYFGISEWFDKNTSELSGGQKQILNLACVMMMSPKLLLLDEPTSQLDPVAVFDFINTLKRINRDFGTTVILAEHRTQEIFPVANKMMFVEDGRLLSYSTCNMAVETMKNSRYLDCFPSSVTIWKKTGMAGKCPISVAQCRNYIESNFTNDIYSPEINEPTKNTDVILECKNLSFRYEKNSDDIVSGLSLTVRKGEIHCILGANGEGKTTLLKLLCGVLKAYKGSIKIINRQKITMISQNVQTMFVMDSIKKDFEYYCDCLGIEKDNTVERIMYVSRMLGIESIIDRHPYDLSGGEQQKCAIAKALLVEPDIILMDEPVKSLDVFAKAGIEKIINDLKTNGVTVVIVTHDTDFAADVADCCSLLFKGEIVSCDVPQRFFDDNEFYTTYASRVSRPYYRNTVTCNSVIDMCLLNRRKGK